MIRMKTLSWFVFVLCALSAAGKVFIAQVGHKTVLDCGVGSFQKILLWQHNNDLLWRHVQNSMKSKGIKEIVLRSKILKQTSLEITRVKEEDAGEFTCKADSESHKHTLVVVSVSVDPPGPLQQGNEANLTCKVNGPSQSYTVEWQAPKGFKVQSQAVHIKSVDVSHKGTWICKVTYEGEKTDANMNIDVQVPVPKTTTASSSGNSKTTMSSVGNSDNVLLLGLNWWVWVAIGLGCLVVIVLIISVIAACKKVRRRKRRLKKMKNGQLQHRPKKYCQCECKTAAAKPQQGRRREKPSALPLQPLLKE